MAEARPIYVAGHRGMVGSALVRRLQADGCRDMLVRTHAELDLTDQAAVRRFFAEQRPRQVYLAAAKVGGILANDSYPAEFLAQNLAIQHNVIDAAYHNGCEKLLFLGSSCIYPRDCPQPIKEEYLLTGPLEKTNEWYAIAKIAGIKMCQAYRKQYGFDAVSVMPTNLYGPGDNYDLRASHVLPALLRKIHEAKVAGAAHVEVWGTGTPRREFLHVDDLADACLHVMRDYSAPEHLNVGTGTDVTIRELAALLCETIGYTGALRFDPTKPDGTPRKLLDVSRIGARGWRAKTALRDGLKRTYQDFLHETTHA